MDCFTAQEANAAEGVAIGFAQRYLRTQRERIDAGGQGWPSPQALSMGGRAASITVILETLQARRDGGGQTRGSAADYQHIGDWLMADTVLARNSQSLRSEARP